MQESVGLLWALGGSAARGKDGGPWCWSRRWRSTAVARQSCASLVMAVRLFHSAVLSVSARRLSSVLWVDCSVAMS